jgi:hypothetical protein
VHLKLIACDVLTREVCDCVARSPHVIHVEFTEKGAHDESDVLRGLIQSKIDEIQDAGKAYDAILLGYGLCGNSTVGIESRDTKLVIPRAHDCCTLFLGSKTAFKQHFADNPSQPFSAGGYIERGDEYVRDGSVGKLLGQDKTYDDYVRLYGKDNARYLVETLDASLHAGDSDKVVFIDVPETRVPEHMKDCRARAEAEGKRYVELEGSIRLIHNLVFGEWNSDDFLIVQPHQRITGVYDWDEIIRGEEIGKPGETDTQS